VLSFSLSALDFDSSSLLELSSVASFVATLDGEDGVLLLDGEDGVFVSLFEGGGAISTSSLSDSSSDESDGFYSFCC